MFINHKFVRKTFVSKHKTIIIFHKYKNKILKCNNFITKIFHFFVKKVLIFLIFNPITTKAPFKTTFTA